MAEKTKIEWADSTFNPVIGCTKISAACDHCYAEGWAKRSGLVEWGNAPRRRTSAATWAKPRLWQRDAHKFFAIHGRRRRVFCASMADVFDNQWDPQWRNDLWDLIRACPDLDWLILTKRPQNIKKMLPPDWGDGWDNVWLGTTVENQEVADRNVPILLNVPAKVRFLSMEPLLGPVDLYNGDPDPRLGITALHTFIGQWWEPGDSLRGPPRKGVDWVIAGGESGPRARPSHPHWFRSLRDQCAAAEVPFLFKQWGDWMPWEPEQAPCWKAQNGTIRDRHVLFPANMDDDPRWDDGLWAIGYNATAHAAFQRVGKKAAGRLLDSVEHNGFPGVR